MARRVTSPIASSGIICLKPKTVRELAQVGPGSALITDTGITFKELKEAHYRIVADTRDEREHAGWLLRARQPGLCAYLPYTPSTIRTLAYENALICSFARHRCFAIEKRFGSVPVLKLKDLLAGEVRAEALLAGRRAVEWPRKLGAVQFAEGGILGVHLFDGIRVIPDRKRVLLKVLTLLICLSDAIRGTPTPIQDTNQECNTGIN